MRESGSSRLIEVMRDVCTSAAAQYDDYYKSFVGLDGKAQSAATVAGVSIGAVVAFIDASRLNALIIRNGVWWHYMIALLPAATALITVILSLVAMCVRGTVVQFSAMEQIDEAEDLAKLAGDEVSVERVLGYYGGRLNHCKGALKNIAAHVESKGRWVIAAQVGLVISLTSLLLLFIVVVFTPVASSAN